MKPPEAIREPAIERVGRLSQLTERTDVESRAGRSHAASSSGSGTAPDGTPAPGGLI